MLVAQVYLCILQETMHTVQLCSVVTSMYIHVWYNSNGIWGWSFNVKIEKSFLNFVDTLFAIFLHLTSVYRRNKSNFSGTVFAQIDVGDQMGASAFSKSLWMSQLEFKRQEGLSIQNWNAWVFFFSLRKIVNLLRKRVLAQSVNLEIFCNNFLGLH